MTDGYVVINNHGEFSSPHLEVLHLLGVIP